MQTPCGGQCGRDVAVAGVEDEGGEGVRCIGGIGRDEPAAELGRAGGVDPESDGLELQTEAVWGLRDLVGRVYGKLPLSLIEEPAEHGIGAEKRDQKSDGESFDKPAWVDDLMHHRGLLRDGFGSAFCHA